MKKPLLAISGKRFSGKDTLAAMLVQAAKARGVTLTPLAFADACKAGFVAEQGRAGIAVDLASLLGDRAYKEARRPQLTAYTMRALAEDPLVFCRAVADQAEASVSPCLVTDLRLPLELDHLRPRFDLWLVRLVRADHARSASGWSFTPGVDDHETETALDAHGGWDETLTNEGTPEQLRLSADDLLTRWLARATARDPRMRR